MSNLITRTVNQIPEKKSEINCLYSKETKTLEIGNAEFGTRKEISSIGRLNLALNQLKKEMTESIFKISSLLYYFQTKPQKEQRY